MNMRNCWPEIIMILIIIAMFTLVSMLLTNCGKVPEYHFEGSIGSGTMCEVVDYETLLVERDGGRRW